MSQQHEGFLSMPSSTWKRLVYRTVWAIAFVIVLPGNAKPERLPIKTYTTSEGLAQNSVNRIVRDSRGFLWFCTEGGLSRYDGYSFTNYGVEQGLPDSQVRDLLETRDGEYFVGAFSGICRFNPKGRPSATDQRNTQPAADVGRRATDDPMFVLYHTTDNSRTGSGNALLEDHTGAVWCGAGRGLYRLEPNDGDWTLRFVDIGLPHEVENDMIVRALAEDGQGALWIGAGSGLYRRWPDGRTERYTTDHGLPANDVLALLIDKDGQLWVGTRKGLSQIALEPGSRQPRIIRVYTLGNGLPDPNTRALFQSSTGQLWTGLSRALVEFVPQASKGGSLFRQYVSELVLSQLFVQALAEDRDGNLWIGTTNGAFKLARNGFTTYTEADGLGDTRISSLFESRAGDLCVMTVDSRTPLSLFDGKRFSAIRPQVPQRFTYFGWGWHQLTLQDRAGEWWLPTSQGLVRYPQVDHVGQLATTPPKAIYTTRDGLPSSDIFRLYEDSRGDIWIATFTEARGGLTRWERATETFHHYGEVDGLPPRTPAPLAFSEDSMGNLWIGFVDTDALARFSEGRFTLFTSEQGLPRGAIRDLHLDHAGRLWIASSAGGLARLDDPGAEQPRFITYTTAQGLSSNSINCITEDRFGRLYAGTARGLDRFDPATDRVKPFTAADGLISGEVLVSFCDRKGDLWFGGKGGLSRLSPQPDSPKSPPPILITGLRIGGEPHQISALGETEIAPVEFGPDKNQIQIDFVALGFSPGEGLRYQYKLEGAGENWSPLSIQRTVNFANLTSGHYRFLVQAVNADGRMSERAAFFSFTILPPVWQRWWFLTTAALLLGLAAYALYRYRVTRLLELERIRTRIATDLHDDIGANLSLIAMASEVARGRAPESDEQMAETLSLISSTSRELVDSMGDIIWAVNPDRDHMTDLVKRMRRFASDVFSACCIAFRFEVPLDDREIRLGAETRREVLLIFKEAVNNIARHSECTQVDIEFQSRGEWLMLQIKDDGKGFDITRSSDGNGLVSMSRRAGRLGGTLEVLSRSGEGTTVTLKTPLR